MDECSGKRAVGGLDVGRRASGLAFRDKSKHENRSVQYCNRIGCSTRINSVRGSQNGTTDTVKYSSPSFYSASRKAMAGNSSKTYSGVSDTRKTHQELQKLSSHKELVPAETISKQEEKNVSESIPSSVRIQTELEPKGAESGVLKHLSADTRKAVGSYSVTSNSRPRRKIYQQSESGSQDTLGPSTRRPIASRNTSHVAKPTSHGQGANANRNDLRNLRCTSMSDVHSSSSSSSDSSHRTDVVKRSTDGESSARGKNMIGPSAGGSSGRQRNSLSSPSFALSEHPSSQQASRRARNCPPSRDGIASVRTRRKHNGETTARLSEHGHGNSLSLPEHPNMIPQLPQTEMLISGTTLPSSSQQIPVELPSICQNSDGQPINNNENIHSMETVHSEDGIAGPFHGLSMDRDGFRHFNMAGVAEVLLALERIEQDEELTYEQLLILETNLFLGGLSFHDQHRDMRLDIDNMSYEELLALEEKMGTVSTALTEEALSNCLKRSFYSPAPSDVGNMGCGDDVKCSICQEQYVEGDEVGKLGCEHPFHVVCIQQWLRRKNWCPICKAPAAPS